MIYENNCPTTCKTLYSLEILLAVAQDKAHKYRWDPTIGQIHQMYADAFQAIVEAERREVNHV